MHFALAKSFFPSDWGATGAGEAGCGACARTTARTNAITGSPSSVQVTAERPFGRLADRRAGVWWCHRLGFSREGEDERDDVRLSCALDRRLRSSTFHPARLLSVPRQCPRFHGLREADGHRPLGARGEEERVAFEEAWIEWPHVAKG